MGQLDVHIRHGGGGDGLSGLLGPAVLIGAAVAVAIVVMEFIAWIAAALGVILLLAVAALIWRLRTQPARKARWAESYRAAFEAHEEAERRQALERHLRALELARASAPVINNFIDPAAIAAAVAGAQLQYPARVLRGEVER